MGGAIPITRFWRGGRAVQERGMRRRPVQLPTHDEDWRRALDVKAALWRGGHVRAVGFPDLLIAAVADLERVTVLHYDRDYELIAQVTSQPVAWVVARGTVP
ncbi:MAG: hypothetical protein ACR2MP_25175 [Streptosporangiaceae bacterium]